MENDKVSDCDATCRLQLQNLQNKNQTTLIRDSSEKYKYTFNNNELFINFGLSSTKCDLIDMKIIYNSDIKIDSRTRLINSDLFINLNFKNNNNNLHIFIPIINDDFSNNHEFNKLLGDDSTIDISDLYNTVFPDTHSFYFISKIQLPDDDDIRKEYYNSNIVIFDNKLKINTSDYFKIKDAINKDISSVSLKYDNAYYSPKLNCLNNNIDLPEELLTEYLNAEKLIEHQSDNLDSNNNEEKSHDTDHGLFYPWRLIVNILIVLYLCPLFLCRIFKFLKDSFNFDLSIQSIIMHIILIVLWLLITFTSVFNLSGEDRTFKKYWWLLILLLPVICYVIIRYLDNKGRNFKWFYLFTLILSSIFIFISWCINQYKYSLADISTFMIILSAISLYIYSDRDWFSNVRNKILIFLIFLILVFFIYNTIQFIGSLIGGHTWISWTIIIIFCLILCFLYLKISINPQNFFLRNSWKTWVFYGLLFILTDPGNLIKKTLGENGFYEINNYNYFILNSSFSIVRYLLIGLMSILFMSNADEGIPNSFNFIKFTLGDISKRNYIIYGMILFCLVISILLSIYKLNNKTEIKVITYKKKNSEDELSDDEKEYINKVFGIHKNTEKCSGITDKTNCNEDDDCFWDKSYEKCLNKVKEIQKEFRDKFSISVTDQV